MYYVRTGRNTLIGASPELIFSLQGSQMETRPIAGSIRRGKTKVEDVALARQLLNDPKEIAEHSMLVDLHRNDLGRVATFGSVYVKELMQIKKFSHIQHIESIVRGQMKPSEDMFSALAANFPMGTVTGAPKIESMKIIDRNEPEPRGPYAGGVGHFGFNGDCTFAVTLRSLFIAGEDAFAQTSGGIVYDSLANNEYDEIQRKLAAMKQVLS
jgi:anthranilate synthase component 1